MKDAFKKLTVYIKAYRELLFVSMLSAIIGVACTLFAPLVIGGAIDAMTGAGQVRFDIVSQSLLLLGILYLSSNGCQWVLTYLTNRISYLTVNELRREFFDKLTVLPLDFYDHNPHGDTTSRFINDADAVGEGMLQGLMALLQGIFTIIGAIVFMLYLNPLMALTVMLTAPAAYFVARFITLRSQRLFRQQAKELGALNGYAEEIIHGQKAVKAFCYEDRALAAFRDINQSLYEVGVKAQFISSLSNPSTRIVNNFFYAAVGVIGGVYAVLGHSTVGEVSSFLIYAAVFAKPFNDITGVFTQIQAAAASAQRIFQILEQKPETEDKEDAKELRQCRGDVAFRDVSFAYRPEQPLLRHFNLEVAPGSSIAIVGHTGAGKTTLVNLLMRFYDVQSGGIYIDDVDIRDLTRENLRRQFGMVLQDTWLFNGTIHQNIAYAKPKAARADVLAAAKDAGADSFIRRLEQGYDTVISADGDNLSQGQKQLLTIARVLLANPPMLILDEATSSIDTYTEAKIQQAFSRLTEGRTSFVIAHRLSTVRKADLILVMEKGSIVEKGNHQELLAKGGVYTKLYNSQFAGATL